MTQGNGWGHVLYTMDGLWENMNTMPHEICVQREQICDYFQARWRQLLADHYDQQTGTYNQDVVFGVSSETSQLLQVLYDAFYAVYGPVEAGAVLLQEYVQQGINLAANSPNIQQYQIQNGMLFQELDTVYGVEVANNTLYLSNRMLRGIANTLQGIEEVTDPDRLLYFQGTANKPSPEIEIFGVPAPRYHVGLASDPEAYDLSPYLDYLTSCEAVGCGYSLCAVVQIIYVLNQFAVICEKRDRPTGEKKERGFVWEMMLYNSYVLLSTLITKLPETQESTRSAQRDAVKGVLTELASYTLSDLYDHFTAMGPLAAECSIWGIVCMDLGRKALGHAFGEDLLMRKEEGSHTLHALGLLMQASMVFKQERGEGDPTLAECVILMTFASHWAGGMAADTALLEIGKAEHTLREAPEHMRGILKSELYFSFRRALEKRIVETM